MARLLIPTRNRPTSLRKVLEFLTLFYPSAEVIVADGSDEGWQAENQRNLVAIGRKISVDYRPYPAALPLFDRILDVLRAERDEFFVMGSDDDFPMMDVLRRGEIFLRANEGFAAAMGTLIHIRLKSPSEATARLGLVRPIHSPTPQERARQFARWSFSTTNAVTRRDVLLERYERARRRMMSSFFDFWVGVHDCMRGKLRAMPRIGFVCTRNYNHSYIRPDDKLIFLRRSEEVLSLVDDMRRDLVEVGNLDEDEARLTSEKLIIARLAENMGYSAPLRKDFEHSAAYKNPIVQRQFELFQLLFEHGSPVREAHAEKLKFISEALRASANSDDNKDEPKTYETIGEQVNWRADASVGQDGQL